jgi:hypothetical protein
MKRQANIPSVNELSNTIDLPSTLVRAEQLFRRFQRTIEAVDRKNQNHFPVPSNVRHRKSASVQNDGDQKFAKPQDRAQSGSESTIHTGAAASSSKTPPSNDGNTQAADKEQRKVISPELRNLLRRDLFYALEKPEPSQPAKGAGA